MGSAMRSAHHRPHRLGERRHSRGVAAIELALVSIPLTLLLLGASEFGRAIYTYNVLTKAARDAARHLSAYGPGDDALRNQARCLAAFGTTDCTGTALATGLTAAMVAVCDASNCASSHAVQATGVGTVNLVSVSISGYSFTSLLSWAVPNIPFRSITATMRGAS